jgi:hypothetical protein
LDSNQQPEITQRRSFIATSPEDAAAVRRAYDNHKAVSDTAICLHWFDFACILLTLYGMLWGTVAAISKMNQGRVLSNICVTIRGSDHQQFCCDSVQHFTRVGAVLFPAIATFASGLQKHFAWHEKKVKLYHAAARIFQEIQLFRTGTGEYLMHPDGIQDACHHLMDNIHKIMQTVDTIHLVHTSKLTKRTLDIHIQRSQYEEGMCHSWKRSVGHFCADAATCCKFLIQPIWRRCRKCASMCSCQSICGSKKERLLKHQESLGASIFDDLGPNNSHLRRLSWREFHNERVQPLLEYYMWQSTSRSRQDAVGQVVHLFLSMLASILASFQTVDVVVPIVIAMSSTIKHLLSYSNIGPHATALAHAVSVMNAIDTRMEHLCSGHRLCPEQDEHLFHRLVTETENIPLYVTSSCVGSGAPHGNVQHGTGIGNGFSTGIGNGFGSGNTADRREVLDP